MENDIIVISAVWCPSCLLLKRELKRLHEEYNLEFKTLDYDLDEEIVKKYNIGDKLPVIIYGNKRLIGEKKYEELVDFFKECNLVWKRRLF